MTAVTTLLAGSIVLASLLSQTGCRLLKNSSNRTLEKIGLRLQPLGAGPDVICLEFISVKQPANDPLLGDSLWNRLDTIGRRPAKMRAALAAGGFHFLIGDFKHNALLCSGNGQTRFRARNPQAGGQHAEQQLLDFSVFHDALSFSS